MKKIITLLAIAIFSFGFSQDKFTLTQDKGLTEYVVTETPDKLAPEIYQKTIDWINKSFQRADVVIQGQVENDYVRFQGIDSSTLCQNPNNNLIFTCIPIRFQVEISIKDGKYKFQVINKEQKDSMFPKYSSNPWMDAVYTFNRKGIIKPEKMQLLPEVFNSLNSSLKDYIQNGNLSKNSNDW